jgi:hypothetical protein
MRELKPLKLERAKFLTEIAPMNEAEWGEAGADRIAFAVSTNPGQPPGPLAKIASGGELARFMLALKVVLARASAVPVLVFDEVDSGVGGATADAVGERLAAAGGNPPGAGGDPQSRRWRRAAPTLAGAQGDEGRRHVDGGGHAGPGRPAGRNRADAVGRRGDRRGARRGRQTDRTPCNGEFAVMAVADLAPSLSLAEAEAEIATLSAKMAEADAAYYQNDAPIMSDGDYDVLRRRVEAIIARFPELETDDSPTKKVGAAPDLRFQEGAACRADAVAGQRIRRRGCDRFRRPHPPLPGPGRRCRYRFRRRAEDRRPVLRADL